jgi:hypothetical protein
LPASGRLIVKKAAGPRMSNVVVAAVI